MDVPASVNFAALDMSCRLEHSNDATVDFGGRRSRKLGEDRDLEAPTLAPFVDIYALVGR